MKQYKVIIYPYTIDSNPTTIKINDNTKLGELIQYYRNNNFSYELYEREVPEWELVDDYLL